MLKTDSTHRVTLTHTLTHTMDHPYSHRKRLTAGDRVLATYEGTWFPATVVRVLSNDYFKLLWCDGYKTSVYLCDNHVVHAASVGSSTSHEDDVCPLWMLTNVVPRTRPRKQPNPRPALSADECFALMLTSSRSPSPSHCQPSLSN